MALPADTYVSPALLASPKYWKELGIDAVGVIDTRAGLLGASQMLDELAFDRYTFMRDAYITRRRSLVYDGNPPDLPDEDDADDSKSAPAPAGSGGQSGTKPALPAAPAASGAQSSQRGAAATCAWPRGRRAVHAAVAAVPAPPRLAAGARRRHAGAAAGLGADAAGAAGRPGADPAAAGLRAARLSPPRPATIAPLSRRTFLCMSPL